MPPREKPKPTARPTEEDLSPGEGYIETDSDGETYAVAKAPMEVGETKGTPQPGEQIGEYPEGERPEPVTYEEGAPLDTPPLMCSFCRERPAKWKTTSPGADPIFVCDGDLYRISSEPTVALDVE